MKCEDFESNVNDLAREQMMEASMRARALAHRDECEVCARRLEDESALSFGLRALAREINDATVPAPGQELLATFRGNIRNNLRGNLLNNQPALTAVPAHRRWRYLAVAVAAMILVVITVAVMRSRATSPQAPPIVKGPSNPPRALPAETPSAPTPDVVSGLKAPAGTRRVSRKRRNLNQLTESSQLATQTNKNLPTPTEAATSDSENPATEITTEFMPVGYASETNMEEGGQLVRVQLPRSALIAFRLPMNINRYDEKVKADVFFGADGMARAIRFVQ
jgi:hypothetical protein